MNFLRVKYWPLKTIFKLKALNKLFSLNCSNCKINLVPMSNHSSTLFNLQNFNSVQFLSASSYFEIGGKNIIIELPLINSQDTSLIASVISCLQ